MTSILNLVTVSDNGRTKQSTLTKWDNNHQEAKKQNMAKESTVSYFKGFNGSMI